MCLGVPGRVVEIHDEDGLRMGTVDFGGVRRAACLAYAEDVDVGDYVVVHVGFAISAVDPAEAARAYELLEEMGRLEGVDLPADPGPAGAGAREEPG